MKTVVYFHGYGSSPNSKKVNDLRSLGNVVIAINYGDYIDQTLEDTLRHIDKQLPQDSEEPEIFVGTSLGGYFAFQMAEYRASKGIYHPTLLINPSIDPSTSLVKYGISSHKIKHLTALNIKGRKEFPLDVMVSLDDNVIPPFKTVDKFLNSARVAMYEQGGHRFDLPEVISKRVDALYNEIGSVP